MLREVLRSIFKKPATSSFPFEDHVPENHRGKIKWIPEKCIYCKLCERSCPTGACKFIPPKKAGEKGTIEIDIGKCVFCYECVLACPKDALEGTPDYKLAYISKSEKADEKLRKKN